MPKPRSLNDYVLEYYRLIAENEDLTYILELAREEHARQTVENEVLQAVLAEALEAIEKIAANGYGLQGIQDDYGGDTNAYNYHAMKYFSQALFRAVHIARLARDRIRRTALNVPTPEENTESVVTEAMVETAAIAIGIDLGYSGSLLDAYIPEGRILARVALTAALNARQDTHRHLGEDDTPRHGFGLAKLNPKGDQP